jgi:CRISPR-associated protein Csh2
MKNLFSCVDVINFGATFAEGGQNLSITGAVQFNQGINKYPETKVITQDILSPFKDSTSEDAQMTSIGKKIVTDEAHYIYGFSVNPKSYEEYEDIIDGFEGYSEEAYKKFKEACLISTTALNTNSKFGCENEFALFIETKEDSKMYLPDISNFIEFSKNEKDIFDLNKLKFLNDYSKEIEKIEIYYNEFLTEIKIDKINNLPIKMMNIYTKKEVE